jgi:hypothetical protein
MSQRGRTSAAALPPKGKVAFLTKTCIYLAGPGSMQDEAYQGVDPPSDQLSQWKFYAAICAILLAAAALVFISLGLIPRL